MRRVPVTQSQRLVAAVVVWDDQRPRLTNIDHYFDGYAWDWDDGHYILTEDDNCLIILADGTTATCGHDRLDRALLLLEGGANATRASDPERF